MRKKPPRFFSNTPGADKKILYHKFTGRRNPSDEAKGMECVDPYDNMVYAPGDVWDNVNLCNRKTCRADGVVVEETCLDDLEYPGECKEIKDMEFMALDYPWCCPRIACPGDEFYIPDEYDEPEFCFDKNRTRELGEKWTDKGKCNLKTCKRDQEVHTEKCPKYRIPKGCNLTEPDLTKEFPECCPTITCPPGKGPKDGKLQLVKKVERPVSIIEWSDDFITTVERIRSPGGIKPIEGYDRSLKNFVKSDVLHDYDGPSKKKNQRAPVTETKPTKSKGKTFTKPDYKVQDALKMKRQ